MSASADPVPRALDPRTVPRRTLLNRAGFAIPAMTLIVLSTDSSDMAPRPTAQRQVVIALTPGHHANPRIEQSPTTAGAGGLPLTVRTAAPNETLPGFLNRAAAVAVGDIIVLALGQNLDEAWLADLADRFRADAAVGIVERAPPEDPPTLIGIRGDLWEALYGFADEFVSLDWAIRDLCLRARSIGYAAPLRAFPPGSASDEASLFHARAAVAPDRSTCREPTNERGAIYTSLTNFYDVLKPQPAGAGTEYIAYLDAPTAAAQADRSRGWTVRSFAPPLAEPHRAARFYKANSHLALPDADYSLWIDASIAIAFPYPLARLAALFLADADICVFGHHARNSVYEEADACKALGFDRAEIIDAQMTRYRREGLPAACGLAELPVILRRHTAAIRALNEAWWAEIVAGSRRDQLSFDYVCWKLGISYARFPLSVNDRNGLFLKFRRQAGPLAGVPS